MTYPTLEDIAEMRRGEAALAEGFCPWDGARLSALTETEAAAASTWAHPPTGWCVHCRCYVGAYVGQGGGYFGAHGLGLAAGGRP